jgi:hypothetical protein
MADDRGREPIPGIARASGCPHPTRLRTPIRSRKRCKARQVDGAFRFYLTILAVLIFVMQKDE